MFGEIVKARRAELRLTLREFCRRLGEDPSNWSKVERGILRPPSRKEKLRQIARVLDISEGSGEWERLVDAAAVGAGDIPSYVMENREVYSALPAFFRSMGGMELTADEIRRMIDQLIKGGTSAAQPETGAGPAEKRAIIVAGPNGAGKTTFVREYLKEHDVPYISADEIAERMTRGDIREVALAAGRRFFTDLYGAIESGRSFVVETTLSGRGFRRVLRRMKNENYIINLIFVYLASPGFCVSRIEERIRKGGHHVPEADVIRRFHRSIVNFRETCRAGADSWYLICNETQQFVEVARGKGEEPSIIEDCLYNTFLEMAGI